MMNILLIKYKNKPLIYYLMKMVPFSIIEDLYSKIRNEFVCKSIRFEQELRKQTEREMEEYFVENPKIAESINKMAETDYRYSDPVPWDGNNRINVPPSYIEFWRKL